MTPSQKETIKMAATRLKQSGKTTLARGLENIVSDLDAVSHSHNGEEQIAFGSDQTDLTIPSDDLSDVPEYVGSNGEFDALATVIEKTKLNALLTGPTGSGKTNLVQAVAKSLGREIFTIQGGGGATYERVVRKDLLSNDRGATVSSYRDGVLPVAMKRGSILYLDEPNAMPNEVLFYLFGAMDHRRGISFDDGSSIKAAKGFTVVAAMNEGTGYAGTNLLNNAFRSRGDAIFQLDYLEKGKEAKLLRDRTGIDAPNARTLVQVASDLRASLAQRNIRTPIGTRDLLAAATLFTVGMNRELALELAIVNKVPAQFPSERKAVADVIAAYFKKEAV